MPATYVQNPLSLSFLDGHYPDVARLIPSGGFNIQINPADIDTSMIALLKAMKEEVIELHITDNKFTINKEHQGALVTFDLTTKAEQPEVIAANAKYICQALQFAKDAYKDFTKEDISLNYTSPIRPFTFRTTCYDYLITPVRRSY